MKTVTYNNGERVVQRDTGADISVLLEDIQQRQVRIETRLCVLVESLGFNAKIDSRRAQCNA